MNGFETDGQAIVYRSGRQTLRVEPWGSDSVRVRATVNPQFDDKVPGALLEPTAVDAEASLPPTIEPAEDENGEPIPPDPATLTCGRLRVEIDHTGRLRFLRADDGRLLLEEPPSRILQPSGRHYHSAGGNLHRVEVRFTAHDDERFYGMGQHRHGRLDQKGCVLDLQQKNCEVTIPFYYSSRGYGFLWHNPAMGRVEFGKTGTRWIADQTAQVDYWVTVGESPAQIMTHYADATGHPPMMPDWASGFWQCKLRYRSQEELLEVAREHKKRNLPMSVIVIDFFHWTRMGDFRFDPELWPDPAGLVRQLEEMGIKTMVSIWPSFNGRSEHFAAFKDNGYLIENKSGPPAHHAFFDNDQPDLVYTHFYDTTHPEARQLFWQKTRDSYYKQGFRVFWLDCCEPEFAAEAIDNLRFYAGTGRQVACLYPLMHEKAFYEGMRAEGQEHVLNLCRSAWAGSQRYGAAVWSGDIESTFESLQVQVRAGLNIAMSGIPWWTTDIGGFLWGDPRTGYFRELIVRWFQFGAFCPLFRLHGHRKPCDNMSGGPNEVWSYGEQAYGIITDLLFLRERIRPYVMQHMQIAADKGWPMMRPLLFDFADDPAA